MLIFCYNCFWWLIFFKEINWYIWTKDTPQTFSLNSTPPGSLLCWGQGVSVSYLSFLYYGGMVKDRLPCPSLTHGLPDPCSPWVAMSQTWLSTCTTMVERLAVNLKMLTQHWVKLREKSISQWYLRENLDWTNIVERGILCKVKPLYWSLPASGKEGHD